ncbi:glycoside hydrolase family 1 protein [Marinitoga arctica]
MEKNITFPKGFLWGSTFSSYQIEKINNKTNWDEWQKKGHIKDGSTLNILDDVNINLFNEIFNLSKEINFNSISFSIEWAKIMPEMNFINHKKLESYKNFILNLKRHNIEPIIILNYFTVPSWFEKIGGFNKKENLIFFRDYINIVLSYLGNIVDYYITFFEPGKLVKKSFQEKTFPNGFSNIENLKNFIDNLYVLHKETYISIKKNNIFSKVSFTKNIFYDLFDYKKNNLLKYIDFISISYDGEKNYNNSKPVQKDDIGNIINPDSIYKYLLSIKKLDKPILIMGTGIADENDIYRSTFLIKTLTYIYNVLKRGIKVYGFHYRSLFDLFEWEYGFSAKYGLYEFDYENIKFHIRSSGKIYSNIIINNGIPSYLEKYTQ